MTTKYNPLKIIADTTKAIEERANTTDADLLLNNGWFMAHAYYLRGVAKNQIGDHQGALLDLTHASRFNSHEPMAYFELAKTKEVFKDSAGAIADYYQYIAVNKQWCDAINDHAIEAYCRCAGLKFQTDDLNGAVKDLQKAQSLVHQPAGFVGRSFAQTARPNETTLLHLLHYYEAAIAHDPRDAAALSLRAFVLYIYRRGQRLPDNFPPKSASNLPFDDEVFR